ncbi:hypothetical protein EC973_009376 [Apophysomyces ossiformis]|uniref:Attractin/MKLN-like beta-propeller domain-containing protein n=1 Tax=Apophysomyces ossiformis TaxID=679940 RepID=A0A8H7BMC7_9FUNG|nr:hypothetical protein EC973_009376 [Apophysomyces ossiformis]
MKRLGFLLVVLATISSVHGYFNIPNYMATLPFQGGMAYVQRNNSLIVYGGANATSRYSNKLFQLTQTANNFIWEEIPQQGALPPPSAYAQAVISTTGASMLVIGGAYNQTTAQSPLQIYVYQFANNAWSSPPGNTQSNVSTAPANRISFSATADKSNNVYIYGGTDVGKTQVYSQLYMYSPSTNSFTALPDPQVGRYGHTASLLSNGNLVVIGGLIQTNQNNQAQRSLATMESLYVYSTSTKQWQTQKINPASGAGFPSTRSGHTAIVTPDDKIIIFGGDNGSDERNRQYLNTIAILDTKTWTWEIPPMNGIPPGRRSNSAAMLVNNQYLTVAFGEATNAYYNDVNVLDLTSHTWIQEFNPSNDNQGSGVSAGLIAGVTVAAVVLVAIIAFLIWRFKSYTGWLIRQIHDDIWKPRTGEPVWAETTRIVFQIFFLFLFTVFLVFVIRQAIESPNITQRIENPAASVDVPDIRFCFDGYPTYPNTYDQRNPGITCQTNNGVLCSNYIRPLNMSIFRPIFSDNLGEVSCFLFRAPKTFQMTSTSGNNNGSRLLFTMYGDQSITSGRVHVSVYPRQMDPNAKVYNIIDDSTVLMSDAEVSSWQNAERTDTQALNIYTIEPYTYSALSYELSERRSLQDVGWNYVGFLPIQNSVPEIESTFRAEAPNPFYVQSHSSLSFIAVFPESYAEVINREVKMYTLVNALGFVGGIFGLLIAAQTWLFGFRPQSPWGVVHRWSVGDMKRSLLRGLQSKFNIDEAGIPLVHPVRQDLNEYQNMGYEHGTQRISRVEQRMQTLELLFKAYYVDDEVFRSLDNATKTGQISSAGDRFPSEKMNVSPQQNNDGFTHMFQRRPSSGSFASDANSQRQLNPHEKDNVPMHNF